MSVRTVDGMTLRLAGERVSGRVRARPVVSGAVLAAATLTMSLVAVATGDAPIPLGDVGAALTGGGDAGTRFIVEELRLPRAVCAVVAGAALGVSGAIFQSLTRNPLGSPDVIGFQSGAATGALVVITLLGGAGLTASAGALTGGLATALAVYLLAIRHGRVSAFRLVLIGIAVAALMVSLNDYLLSRARVEDAQEAMRWLLGSLSGRTWEDAVPLLVALAVLAPLCALAARPLRALEVGEDAACGLGVRVERTRAALVALAVGLVAVTTTAVGPVAFVALTAPQIARRLSRTPGVPIMGAALTGGLIVQASDVLAQRLVPSTPLPVGVVTGALGGVYLMWLLASEWRSGHA